MVANSANWPRSHAIISWRRRPRRSAQAPACIPNNRLGSHWRAVSSPIVVEPACSASTAVNGTATAATWSPPIEMADADQ